MNLEIYGKGNNMARDWLKEARIKMGYTRKQLEKLTGIKEMTIYRYEKGLLTPRNENAIKISKVLKIQPIKFYEIKKEIKSATNQK